MRWIKNGKNGSKDYDKSKWFDNMNLILIYTDIGTCLIL